MRSVNELLHEAKWGKLSQEEIDYIANRIKESRKKEDPDLYILIYALGKSGAIEYRDLIESFLHYPSNPCIVGIAFKALVHYLDLIDEYLLEIKLFLKRVDWDECEIVRISAISAAGRYLSGSDDRELWEELIRIFMDGVNENDDMRMCAYSALGFALWRSPNELCGVQEIDESILLEAKVRLEKCKHKEVGNDQL